MNTKRYVGRIYGVLAAAAILAACHDETRHAEHASPSTDPSGGMRTLTALTCPDTMGELKRISQASDGLSCQYRADGEREDVALSLLTLGGATPARGLMPLEASLKADAGPHAVSAASDDGDARSEAGGDHARIDLPGLHINADGDRAQVRIAGVTINADGDAAHVQAGSAGHATVDAHPGGAEIRADHSGPGDADLTLVLASDTPGPHGDTAVGYIARGPAAGPLVVAAFRSKSGRRDIEDTDLKRLVDLNVRG